MSEYIVRSVRFTLEYMIRRGSKNNLDRDIEAVLGSIRDGLAYEPAWLYALDAVLELSQYMWERGAWRAWDAYVVDAVEVARRLSRLADAAFLITYRAGLCEALGDWDQTLALVSEALRLAPVPETKASALLYAGTALHNRGRFRQAYLHFSEALEISGEEATRMRIMLKLSRTLRALRRRRSAEKLVDELLRWESASLWFAAEVVLEKVGYLKSKPEIAMQYAQRGLIMYQELAFDRGIAYAELAMGRVNIGLHELTRAADHLERSAALFLKAEYWPGMAHVTFARGRIAMKSNFYLRAAEFFDESAQHAARTAYNSMLLKSTMLSCLCLLRSGRARAALNRLWSAAAMLASIQPRLG